MSQHAVWSWHVPASPYEGTGFRVVDGGNVIPAVPIEVFSTRDEAEAWRLGRLEQWRGRG